MSTIPLASRPVASRLALSELAPGTVQSEIRAMSTACEQMGGINLAQGVCDTPVPAVVEQAAIEAIQTGHNIYTRLDGIARLRNAIAAAADKFNWKARKKAPGHGFGIAAGFEKGGYVATCAEVKV